MVAERIVCRLLMVVSLSLYAVSVFLPWMVEYYSNTRDEIKYVNRYWSFQMSSDAEGRARGLPFAGRILLWRFHEYWFFPPFFTYLYPYISRDWFSVFVIQMIVVVTGTVGIVREKVHDKPSPLVYSTTCSILTLIFGCFQWVRQLELRGQNIRVFIASSASFDMGFYLALIAVILWIISLSFDRLMKQRQNRAEKRNE